MQPVDPNRIALSTADRAARFVALSGEPNKYQSHPACNLIWVKAHPRRLWQGAAELQPRAEEMTLRVGKSLKELLELGGPMMPVVTSDERGAGALTQDAALPHQLTHRANG